MVRWGIIGCGDVTEVKSGPAFQKASGSALVAVMRRDRAKAEDYARRHGVERVHTAADDLIRDSGVDAVYIATPPASHAEIAIRVAAARKPCLVEKPMAASYADCTRMLAAFERAAVPLWVAYYRRALPRFLLIRDLLESGSLGRVTSVHVELRQPLASPEAARTWRFNRALAGGGLFYDMGSHAVDLLDFLFGPAEQVRSVTMNTGGLYEVEDVTVATFRLASGVAATGVWNFNAGVTSDALVVTTSNGEVRTAVFDDVDVMVTRGGEREVHAVRNPPHVHQPLIQTIVDELAGRGRCESTAASGARASRVLEMCTEGSAPRRLPG
jgi:1,5-anhydro-D-fructose reductase (1,5-anhydro-D-mannitol-forming)